jgi:glycosyltransferase involved in cell wall biosynthesis
VKLEKALRGALKEVNAVSHLLEDLKHSRRWRIGNAVGDVYRRLRSISREEGLPELIENRLEHARKVCQDVLKGSLPKAKQVAQPKGKTKPQKTDPVDNAYTNFEEYWRWATLNRTVKAPFSEPDKRVLGYLDGQYERMRKHCGHMVQGPLVSVIMPTYNRADVIGEAVASVVAQTYTNWELLVVDDAGTDDTEQVLHDIGDRRIHYIKSTENRGASGARNVGLEQARGEYIAYLDSDNRVHEDFLLLMVNQLMMQPQHRSAYCAQRAFDRTVTRSGKIEEELRFIRFGPFNRSLLENKNFIDINAFVHHRSLFDDLGGFDKSMRRLVDWELLIRYTRDDAPLAVPAVLSDYIYAKQNQQITDVEKFRPAYNAIGERLASDVLEIGVEGRKEGRAHKLKSLIGIESLSLENGLRFEGETLYHRLGQTRLGQVARPVAIVIPSYQAYEYLQICVSAIETFTPEGSYELIIVDNASNENVREFLRELEASGRAKIHLNDENLGFTAAVNQGIEMAQPNADIILLNNDAVVTRGWLEALQEVPELMSDVGVVAPRQVLPAMSKTMDAHVPGCARERELDVTLSAHHQNIIDPSLDPVRGLMELSFAPFFCVYITRD